jgi:acyl dehydratase
MTLNLDMINKPLGPVIREYDWRDVILYALGVGAGFEELDYCFEKRLKVLPSQAIAMIFDFLMEAGLHSGLNPAGVLHGEQSLIFHRPMPTQGCLETRGRITHMYDKGKDKGALIIVKSETAHCQGQKLFSGQATFFARLDGGFGGAPSPSQHFTFPDREPDFCIPAHPAANQPLLYRLSGDLFELHVNPDFARLAGFEKPIMHGLCTHGYACRALIEALAPGAPETLKRLDCRFSKPLYPGIPIETHIWRMDQNMAVWRTQNRQSTEIVIDRGLATFDPTAKNS